MGRNYDRGRPVGFIYGYCKLPHDPEGGCASPVEILNFPQCAENVAKYDSVVQPAGFLTMRGRRVAVFKARPDQFEKLLVTTGTTSIDIYANDLETAKRVLLALRSADGAIKPGVRLPPPRLAPRLCRR